MTRIQFFCERIACAPGDLPAWAMRAHAMAAQPEHSSPGQFACGIGA